MLKTPYTNQQMLDLLAKAHALPADLSFASTPSSTNKVITEQQSYHRNLLNNPCFKIDQRQGYVVPPNITVVGIDGTSGTWTTDIYYTVNSFYTVDATEWGKINANGGTYAAQKSDCVRGYCTAWKYGADSWILAADKGVLFDGESMTLEIGASVQNRNPHDFWIELLGKPITISVMTADGTIYTKSGTMPSTAPTQWTRYFDTACDGFNFAISGVFATLVDTMYLEMYNVTKRTTIKAAMLEEGSVSTMQAWIDSGAYDETTDLLECMRYFIRLGGMLRKSETIFGYGNVYSGRNAIEYSIPVPVPMVKIPTVTPYGNVIAESTVGSIAFTSGVAFSSAEDTTAAQVAGYNLITVPSTWVANEIIHIRAQNANSYIDISAEL